MTERKNIDRLFQEKFKDFDADPPEQVWINIEKELKKKDKKRVIPLWFRLTGIAAALIIGLFILNQFFGDDKPSNSVVIENAGHDSISTSPAMPANRDEVNKSTIEIQNENNRVTQINNEKPGTENKNIDAFNPKGNIKSGNKQNNALVTSEEKSSINLPVEKSVSSANQNNRINKSKIKTVRSDSRNVPATLNKYGNNAVANKSSNSRHKAVTDKTAAPEYDIASRSKKQVSPENGVVTSDKNINANISQPDNIIKTAADGTTPTNLNPIASSEKSEVNEKKIDTAIAVVPNALEELLNEKEKKEVVTKELKLNRWQITSNVAPIYFGSTSNGSPLDSRFESTDKTYKQSLSYGLGLQYAVNKKLALRAGVNTVSLEYNTNDVVFFQTPNARQLENVDANLKGSLLEIDTQTSLQNNVFGRINNKFSGILTQKTGYIEVPIELTYKIIDRRFGIKAIGGVSTLFLNQNEISILSPGLEMNIGEANNLNKMHFSTNVGLGLKYDILKSLQINVDPMFKYHLNTFNNNVGDFKPYILGIYTGLSFKF